MSDSNNEENKIPTKQASRRNFLKTAGFTVGGIAIGAGFGNILPGISTAPNDKTSESNVNNLNYTDALVFFTREEDFATLAAAVEVIFPKDDLGPGAIELGVPYYIDKQLATPWGKNAGDYMERPFKKDESPLNRSDKMVKGIRKINEISASKHKKQFNELSEKEQIDILKDFENNKVDMHLVSSAAFFSLLHQLTIEGCYCDPLYGGNKNMKGWKMKKFPGAHMSHKNVIEEKDFVEKEPLNMSSHIKL